MRGLLFTSVLLIAVFNATQLFAQIQFDAGTKLWKDFAWNEAREKVETAIRFSPFNSDYYKTLGDFYQHEASLSMNRRQKEDLRNQAIGFYEKAIRFHPYQAESRYQLALLYEKKKQIDRAKDAFRAAIVLEPKNPKFLSDYGFFATRHSMVEQTLLAFEQYKELPHKEVPGRVIHLINILTSCYSVTQDVRKLRRVIPDTSDGHFELGHLLSQHGRWDFAEAEFEQALQRAISQDDRAGMLQRIEQVYRKYNRTLNPLRYQLSANKDVLSQ